MSRAVFQSTLGGSTTLDAEQTADTKTLVIPAADGTLVYTDDAGVASFDDISLTGAVIAGAWDGDTIDVAHGGTGAVTLTGYVKGAGTTALTASATIPNSDITGLGTMSTQNASAVAITGGTISGLGTPLAVPSGGSGAATLTGYVIGNGTSAMTASATIPNTDITGLGTMSVQGSDAVTITGGTANGLTIGASNPAAVTATTLRVNSTVSLAGNTGTAGQVLTSNGGSAPTWQSIAGSGTVTSVDGSGGTTGLSLTGGPITASGTLTLGGTLAVANGGTGSTTAPDALTALGAYPASNPSGFTSNTGTVTSVGGTGTVNGLTLTGTVTTSGNLTLGGTLDLSAPPAIGGATPAAGTFTSLNATSGVISANSATDALRITQTGAGNALLVEDSANPDSSPVVINNSGVLISGYTKTLLVPTAATGSQVSNFPLQINGASNTASVAANSWSNTAGGAAAISLNKSRGTTPETYTISSSGDTLGFVQFTGSDGTNFISGAHISAAVDGTPGTNDMPGRLVFSTTADGASSPTERMRIGNSGTISLGAALGAESLRVTPVASAVNYLNATGAVTTASPSLSAAGSDTNIDITLTPKGTGIVKDALGNIRAVPQSGSAKTTSYTLTTGDVGEFIQVGTGGSVTIPDATFAAGDAVSVFNNTTGNITITCTITTAYIAGTDADKATVTLATRGVCTILFISGTVCVISGNVT